MHNSRDLRVSPGPRRARGRRRPIVHIPSWAWSVAGTSPSLAAVDTYPLQPTGESAVWHAGDLRRRFGWRYLASLERGGILEHPWHGAFGTPPRDLTARILALQVAVSSPVVACHHTAAALWGFGVLRDDRLHVTTLEGRSRRPRTGVVLHQQVPRAAVRRHPSGLMVTDPADAGSRCRARVQAHRRPRRAGRRAQGGPRTRPARGRGRPRARTAGHPHGARPSEYASHVPESPMESRTRFRLIELDRGPRRSNFGYSSAAGCCRDRAALSSRRVGVRRRGLPHRRRDDAPRRCPAQRADPGWLDHALRYGNGHLPLPGAVHRPARRPVLRPPETIMAIFTRNADQRTSLA